MGGEEREEKGKRRKEVRVSKEQEGTSNEREKGCRVRELF